MKPYLQASKIIDSEQLQIVAQAARLANASDNQETIAKACFEFVRDEIKHSWDHQLEPVTCKASDVLKHGTGYCYAKSHLLAALLRANGIPAGLCYQRLTINDNQPPFCLHGLNAICLEPHGWFRVDARGNKPSVNAQFKPPQESLDFPCLIAGEIDLPEIWPEPMAIVVQRLESANNYLEVAENLPDIELLPVMGR